MNWNERVSTSNNAAVQIQLAMGYGMSTSLKNSSDDHAPAPTFGTVATKILDSEIRIWNDAGRVVFQGSLMELCFTRLRSFGLGAGGASNV